MYLLFLALSFPSSLLICPQLVTWHFYPIPFLPMTCLYFSSLAQFGLPGNSLLLGFSWEYPKMLENTMLRASKTGSPDLHHSILPGSAGPWYFLGDPLTHPSHMCNFEGKPFNKCLQLDFTLGQECDYFGKNLTEWGLRNITTGVQISVLPLPSSGVMGNKILKLSKHSFLKYKLRRIILTMSWSHGEG